MPDKMVKRKKTGKKKRKSILDLSPEELLAEINPPGADIYYFPVRHHSPVSSYFLEKAMSVFDPDIVLVEGPTDAEGFINDIADVKTTPPVALYTYFSDKNNKLGYNGTLTAKSDIPLRVTGWYPFTEFSPEYQAITFALKNKKQVHFIDMPLAAKLKFEKEIADNKDFFTKYSQWSEVALAESSYMERLIKKTNFRDFNEYWNHYFEVNTVTKELDDYLKQLLTFASVLRHFNEQDSSFPVLKTEEQREKYMASQIAYWRDENPDKRIFIVTGAIHSVALPFTKTKAKAPKKTGKELTCALSPFSYTRISNLSGYTSGIESPYYQNEIWKRLQGAGSKETVYDETALQILLEVSRKLQESNSRVSTADSINSYHIAKNLASFRGSAQVTHDDLNDAILTCFVKGEIDIQGREVLKATRELLIGNKVGRVFSSRGNPLEEDFFKEAKRLRIPVESVEKKLRVEIYKREKHRQKSHFLHQTVFLGLGFAKLDKGPNYINKTNLELLTEQWKVRWWDRIATRLLELTVYGSTLAECAQAVLLEKIAESYQSLEQLLEFLIISLMMGFNDIFEDLMRELNIRTGSGQNFADLVKALATGTLLYNYRESLLPRHNNQVEKFVYLTYTNSVSKLKDLINLPDDQIEEQVLACRTLSAIAIETEIDLISSDIMVENIERIINSPVKIVPQIEGAFTGILHSFNHISEIEVVDRFNGRAYSNEGAHSAAEFLAGLFMLNKTVMVTSQLLLQAINDSFTALSDDVFLEILPGLRKCFTSFIPREINYIAQKIAKITGLKPQLTLKGIPAEALNALQVLDQEINRSLSEDWGL